MRFKLDENIHPDVVALLNSRGHDARTVAQQDWRGMTDDKLASAIQPENRALLTFDIGFGDIRRYPPARHAGIVVLRLTAQHREAQLAAAERLCEFLEIEPLAGRLWIAEDHGIRIRS